MKQPICKTFSYEGCPITFNNGDSIMVNATEMARPFGKRPSKWLELPSTKEFLSSLLTIRKSDSLERLIVSIEGRSGGTWMHEDVALEFARWLSPYFAIWCNDRIKELLTQGVTTINNDDETIANAMYILQRRLEANKQELQVAHGQIEYQQQQLAILTPKAEYTDTVLQSSSTYTLTQVANDLGLRSIYTLTNLLSQKGVIYRQSGQWIPTAKYRELGIFATRTANYFHSDGSVGTSISTVVTESGRKWLHEYVKKNNL